MLKIAAHYWFRPNGSFGKFPIISFNDNGVIIEIRERDSFIEEPGLKLYNGILIPRFVNIYNLLVTSVTDAVKVMNISVINGIAALGVNKDSFPFFDINNKDIKIIKVKNTNFNKEDSLTVINKISGYTSLSEGLLHYTINNAKLLGIDNVYGSLAIGKTPGLMALSGVDYDNFMLRKNYKIKHIIL